MMMMMTTHTHTRAHTRPPLITQPARVLRGTTAAAAAAAVLAPVQHNWFDYIGRRDPRSQGACQSAPSSGHILNNNKKF